MKLGKIVVFLLYGALLFPVAIALAALGVLLGAMGDSAGHGVLQAVALVLGFLWILDLIALLLSVAVSHVLSIGCCADAGEEEEEEESD